MPLHKGDLAGLYPPPIRHPEALVGRTPDRGWRDCYQKRDCYQDDDRHGERPLLILIDGECDDYGKNRDEVAHGAACHSHDGISGDGG